MSDVSKPVREDRFVLNRSYFVEQAREALNTFVVPFMGIVMALRGKHVHLTDVQMAVSRPRRKVKRRHIR